MQSNDELLAHIDSVDSMICDGCGVEFDVEDFEPFSMLECPQCGKEDIVPGKLDNFLLIKTLGSGGMGVVYKGHDVGLDRDVAVKIMSKKLGANKEFIEDFKCEARSAAKLNHPNIAQIYAVGENNGLNYIVMEYVPGNRLDQMIEPDKPLDQAVVLKIGIDIASGLQDASKIHLIHSDIKPENILLDKNNNAKLIDFGIASFDGANKVENNEVWGTPYYISPEKVKNKTLDVRSDMYSLGTTLYHALAGIPPFDGETSNDVVAARFENDPKDLHEIRPYIHADVERIIHKMIMLAPDDRYPTYKELIKEMTETLEKLTGVRVEIPKSSISDKPATSKSGSKKKLVIKKAGAQTTEPVEEEKKEEQAPTSTRSGKKIVMTKAGSKKLPVTKPVDTPASQDIDEDDIQDFDDDAEEPPISDFMASMIDGDKKKKKKKPKSKAAKIVTIVLLAVFIPIILGGGIFGLIIFKGIKDAAAEVQAQMTYISEKESKINGMKDSMQKVVGRLKEKDELAMKKVNAAIENVFVITGERLTLPPLPVTTEEPAPAPALVAADTNQVVAVDTNAVVPAPEPAVIDDGFGDMGGEMATEKHDAVEKLEEQFEAANALKAKVIEAEGLVSSVDKLIEESNSGTNDMTKAVIDSAYSKAIELAKQMATVEAAATKDLASVQRASLSITKMREDYILNVADKKAAEELAAKQAAEEKARQEAKAAKQRKINNEKEQVRMARMQYDQLIKENDYKTASRKISRDVIRNLTTPEGKDFLKYQEDRLQLLEDYKEFLIKQFEKDPLKLASMPTVTGASTLGIKLNDEIVPWAKVSAKQMLGFAAHYLGTPAVWTTPQTNKLKLRELAKMRLAVAIYCYEVGGTPAYPLAKQYADKAIDDLSNYQDDVQNMMPEILELQNNNVF
ncbi:MAG: serine/threonine-protein kinase [Kiritimatiellae bacterium]|jgi:serine/threonine protein kinase|nr:serine/threonine-protein kinase [Kiritimatiellia bacterium]